MPHLTLVSSTDIINLDDVANFGTGTQALSGATGLGFPEVSAQWIEGAGDGAVYRGSRLCSRDIDLPLYLAAADRPRLQEVLARLEVMLAAGEVQLRWYDDDGTYWYTNVAWQGGGKWTYGADTTGERYLRTVITLRAGSPYWTSSRATSQRIENGGAGRGLLNGSLTRLALRSSQTIGAIRLDNTGTAPAYPIWTVHGPGGNFKAISPSGQRLWWAGTLTATDKLTVDTQAATVVDQNGTNRYAELATAPRFWAIPPGTSVATASLENVSAGTIVAGGAVTSTNYATNPNFESTTGMAVTVSTAGQLTVSVVGSPGGRVGRWTSPADTGTATYRVALCTALARENILAGSPYTLVARVRMIGWAQGTLPLRIAPPSGVPTVLANTDIANIGSVWQEIRVPFTAAINAASDSAIGLYVSLPLSNPTVDSYLEIDYWGVFGGTYTGRFFSGSTTSTDTDFYAWTGTAEASTSTRQPGSVTGRSSITCAWRPRKRVVI